MAASFAAEVPLFMAILGPALLAGSWSLSDVAAFYAAHPVWALANIPGFAAALIATQGKLERVPFDTPEAETEIVAGAFTEYGGRHLALFRLAIDMETVVLASIISAVFLVLVIAAAVIKQRHEIGDQFAEIGLAALAFNVASLAVGYFLPRAFGVVRKQAVAIGMEIGIHNGTLAITLALTVLESQRMSIPAAIYSLIMFFTAGAFGAWMASRAEPATEAEVRAAA